MWKTLAEIRAELQVGVVDYEPWLEPAMIQLMAAYRTGDADCTLHAPQPIRSEIAIRFLGGLANFIFSTSFVSLIEFNVDEVTGLVTDLRVTFEGR